MLARHRFGRGAVFAAGVLFALARAATPAVAQTGSPLSCPDSGVVALSTDSLGWRVLQQLGASVDTTYTLSVDRRRWTWRNHATEVTAGLRGTRPASWHVCTGAWVSFRRATVVLENARGTVHVRASLEPLLEVLRHRSMPRENPGRENR